LEVLVEKEYLSVDQMAEELGVSRSTAWKWIRDRQLQTFRFAGDRKTYVLREDVKVFREPILIDPAKKDPAAHKLAA
jgi:excisionase family DNA binding protein